MQVFVAFNISDQEAVRLKIASHYSQENCYESVPNCFFIATNGETTRQLATKIGLGDNGVSSGIVIPVTSYWGLDRSELWEWINVKQGS